MRLKKKTSKAPRVPAIPVPKVPQVRKVKDVRILEKFMKTLIDGPDFHVKTVAKKAWKRYNDIS